MTTATVHRHQLAAAVALGDRAAELILRARLGCTTPGCRRAPLPGWLHCPTCRAAILDGRAVA